MKLTEAKPESQVLKKYIDRYQFFDIEGPSFLKTIPNGKIDLYTILKGGFEIWDKEKERFEEVPKFGYLPATNSPTILKISKELVCLNIKLNLNVLAVPWFLEIYLNEKERREANDIWQAVIRIMQKGTLKKPGTMQVHELDQQLCSVFETDHIDHKVFEIVRSIEEMEEFSVTELAKNLHVSPRTLNRLTRRYFRLSPKDLASILRFERTTSYLKENESEGLIEALSFGYYDQSHFIKECRKITGTSPKKLFRKMKLSTNDLLVGNTQGVLTGS